MCNCIKVLKETITKQYGTEKKTIEAVEMVGDSLAIDLSDSSLMTAFYIEFKARVKNQKGRITVPVKATFCPFCGESLKKAEGKQK